mgnify:CR=1 FL=1
MQGVGKMTYTNGDYYDGEWFENNRVGKGEGVLHLPDGSIYLGSFLDCLADGTGVMKYENGDVFEGLWRDDEKNGQGTYKYVSGDIFVGSDWNTQPLTMIQNGSASGFYNTILTAPIVYMAWGNGNYLYVINKTEDTNRVQKIDTRITGSDYFGRP